MKMETRQKQWLLDFFRWRKNREMDRREAIEGDDWPDDYGAEDIMFFGHSLQILEESKDSLDIGLFKGSKSRFFLTFGLLKYLEIGKSNFAVLEVLFLVHFFFTVNSDNYKEESLNGDLKLAIGSFRGLEQNLNYQYNLVATAMRIIDRIKN